MNIVMVGTGYVGLVSGVCFADLGNRVTCVDIDEKKIVSLQNGVMPFYEPGLKEVMERNVFEGRLYFSPSLRGALQKAEMIFITVGTPPQEDGSADLQYVFQVAEEIGKTLDHFVLVVDKSTVPVGTARKVFEIIRSNYQGEFAVASNPEFLREGSALEDFRHPDRIVIGVDDERGESLLLKLYESFSCPKVVTNLESAEMIKYAANAFLATKISFINEIANVCEALVADVDKVAEGMGLDGRIGPKFFQAGIGYGGSCFPKDVRALDQVARGNHYHFHLLKAVIEVNNRQREIFIEKIKRVLGDLVDKKIAVWGLAFKPNTDDTRESAAVDICKRLLSLGARISAYDPEVREVKNIRLETDMYEVVKDAEALLLLTEWDQFRNPDWERLQSLLKQKNIFDGRGIYQREKMREKDFNYFSLGR